MTEPTDAKASATGVAPAAEPAPAGERGLERRVLAGLASELEHDLAVAKRLRLLARIAPELDELAGDAVRQIERASAAAVITLVGSTGAGKSTLLNALVGRKVAREGEDRPTTSAPVVYRPRDADLSELLDGLPGETPRIVDYDPRAAGNAGWSGQVLVDAPDTNSVETLHRDVVTALAARSDVLVVVAHRQSIAELSSARFVDAFAGRRGMLFVLNRADEVSDAARAELLDQLRGLAAERWRAPDASVLAVSAREAQTSPERPDWRALVAELSQLATVERVGGVRRRNALGAVASLAERVRAVAGEAHAALERVDDAERAGLEGWRADVEAMVSERLELRSNDLVHMLWNDAAKTWDGPGGYALRAGGLATLGLGAGAFLARRNPALAAGAAVGALAADRAREAWRERSFQSTSGLLPGEGELERVQRDRMSEARLAAEDAMAPGASGALLVPEGSTLTTEAARAVEESYEELLAVDLPSAARASLPRFVPWLVDLPVYALVAWIVWSAAVSLYRNEYIGLDMILTASIVALAWLFLCRSLVRRVLGLRSSRLLARVKERIAGRLRADGAALLDAQGRALASHRAALDRLADLDRRWRARLRA